jgi:hypothetical protein
MASSGKKKTTMAKLSRESRLRERRVEKEARKQARKQAAAHPVTQPNDPSSPASNNLRETESPRAPLGATKLT